MKDETFVYEDDIIKKYEKGYADWSLRTSYVSPERFQQIKSVEEYKITELDAVGNHIIIFFKEL